MSGTLNRDGVFAGRWRAAYPSTLPVGYLLREKYPNRWLRIHSLPEGKRWPESKVEVNKILRRHNAVLNALMQPSDQFMLLTTGYSEELTPVSPVVFETERTLKKRSKYAFTGKPDPGGPFWHFFVSAECWEPGRCDGILSQIANDTVADVLFVDAELGWVYHPYDGGGDVIAQDAITRKSLLEKFCAWISPRKDGL